MTRSKLGCYPEILHLRKLITTLLSGLSFSLRLWITRLNLILGDTDFFVSHRNRSVFSFSYFKHEHLYKLELFWKCWIKFEKNFFVLMSVVTPVKEALTVISRKKFEVFFGKRAECNRKMSTTVSDNIKQAEELDNFLRKLWKTSTKSVFSRPQKTSDTRETES